jgi:hypothetical protein
MVLFGCTCGYLGAMERFTRSFYDDCDVILISGKQGNLLYLDAHTQLPIRCELKNMVVEFSEYGHIDGFGNMPYAISTMSEEGILTTSEIIEVAELSGLPSGFFDIPKQTEEITLD